MKRLISILFATLFVLFLPFQAMAQSPGLLVATGDLKKGSTYAAMFEELKARCDAVNVQSVTSNGGLQNFELLAGNKVNAAMLQLDLLYYNKSRDPAAVDNIRTLFTLHPEQLHFLARSGVKVEGTRIMGIGGKDVTFNSIADLSGRTVGAVGGSVLTAQIVSAQTRLNFKVVNYDNNDILKQALLEHKIDGALVVGGAPHGLVASLTPEFKLLEVAKAEQDALAAMYKPISVSYPNLRQTGIKTVYTSAAMVTRTYRSKAMQDQLSQFRQCFVRSLTDIQDARGTHAAWQNVNADDKGLWPYYDLPAK